MDKTVVELFAGVGGFRIGLNKIKKINKNGKAAEIQRFKIVWANQWEPSTKAQQAFECYMTRFNCKPNECSNEDISNVKKENIPNHALLCGGFPCQDYSVARSLKDEKGIQGKKGVLWWQINDILIAKKPPFVLLENVDRLLKSPSKQRGQAFGIMLRCFYEQGYSVEWRVINAAQYGTPQRRRRIFLFAYKETTKFFQVQIQETPKDIIQEKGLFAKSFPIEQIGGKIKEYNVTKYKDLVDVSENFKANFETSGYMKKGVIYTVKSIPIESKPITLGDIVETKVNDSFYLDEVKEKKFEYLRGSKKVLRTRKTDGGQYYYSEGAMSPYDSLELPGRTMLTSEGTTNRSSHIIKDPHTNKLRFLTPVECERLNQFPDDWTSTMSARRRYFMMGNALVCGIVSKIGDEIFEIIEKE
ncbi:MAG: DNA (cytosine-5-)-methyltransferase [Malacoplasma sp.]|nr:DNA (cytosine-5-)-methyltransferase [Malacoplasma sp.]